MTDLRQTVSDQLGGLESLALKIPGYKGYKEKEMRREADALLRQHLAAKLGAGLSQAEGLAKQMLTGPGLSQLTELNSGNTRLQTNDADKSLTILPLRRCQRPGSGRSPLRQNRERFIGVI